jgi:hypothetical protein
MTPEVATQLADWGVNGVRINFGVDKGFDQTTAATAAGKGLAPYREGIERLRAFLTVCHKRNLKVIICASGIPGRKLDVLWNQTDDGKMVRKHLASFWDAFAREFRDEPAIIAYDIFNEPNYKPGQEHLWIKEMLPEAVAAIRAVNPGIWLLVEPGPWGLPAGLDQMEPLDDPRVIYSFHQYAPHNYTHQGVGATREASRGTLVYPGMLQMFDSTPARQWDRAALRESMRSAIDFAAKTHARILVGEFGVARWAPGRGEWLADNIALFEEQGWDWMFHSPFGWNGWSPTYDPDAPSTMTTENGGVTTPQLEALLKGWSLNSDQKKPGEEAN